LKSITVQGFSILDYLAEAAGARTQLIKWMQEGKLRRVETLVRGGLEKAPTALADLLAGKNVGKMVVEVKAP
jgi:NADPH-dependent curcumin reductase CurA